MTKYSNKEELSKSFAETLKGIKHLLPKGYHKQILDALPDVTQTQIMNAFIGRPVANQTLTKIFNKAIELAYNGETERQAAQLQHAKLLNLLQEA